MKTGRDIDSIYRDRLKGAKMSPPPDAWDNILSRLPEKEEKRKFFPLWMTMGGVAAALAILFAVLTIPGNSTSPVQVSVNDRSEKLNFGFSEVSTTFDEVMQESAILLQALILQSQEMKFQPKRDLAGMVEREVRETQDLSEAPEILQKPYETKNDAPVITSEEEKELSEKIASATEVAVASAVPEKEEPVVPKNTKSEGKFRLSTRIAPVYFNNFGSGNAVDNNLSQRSGAGEVTISYGVNIAYEVSEKVNIRSGINKVDLAYNTSQISFNDIAATKAFGDKLNETTLLSSSSSGTLNQKMGFVEVPLEMEYVVVDKKFALGLIGGGSALFLQEDQVSLETFGNKTDLGETNSMNKLSFTTNFGISLGYDVSRQLQLSLEPVVKLQMNTFRNSDGSNPYFFGIYSGFSYRF